MMVAVIVTPGRATIQDSSSVAHYALLSSHHCCEDQPMAVTTAYRDYVFGQLEAVGKIISKNMFGGVGIYQNGRFFALIFRNALYFKVDEVNRPDYENAGMKPFTPYPGRSGSMQY